MSKDQRRAQTKKALLDALVICLEDQDFNDITTIRLVQTAGISRSSFYTHYKDKSLFGSRRTVAAALPLSSYRTKWMQ